MRRSRPISRLRGTKKQESDKILISACLLGINCKYNGGNNSDSEAVKLSKQAYIIPVCPEQLGGCSTPRPPSEIINGDGADVLAGKAVILSIEGREATDNFLKGAYETLSIARAVGARKAVLKSGSPSCGCGSIYDGTFTGSKRKGNGVTAQLLMDSDIRVVDEYNIKCIL